MGDFILLFADTGCWNLDTGCWMLVMERVPTVKGFRVQEFKGFRVQCPEDGKN
jgi:hypothetical protein